MKNYQNKVGNHYVEIGGKCTVCGRQIKPRYAGLHKNGVCHQCRCKQLRRMERGVQGSIIL